MNGDRSDRHDGVRPEAHRLQQRQPDALRLQCASDRFDGLETGAKARHRFAMVFQFAVRKIADVKIRDVTECGSMQLRAYIVFAIVRSDEKQRSGCVARRPTLVPAIITASLTGPASQMQSRPSEASRSRIECNRCGRASIACESCAIRACRVVRDGRST